MLVGLRFLGSQTVKTVNVATQGYDGSAPALTGLKNRDFQSGSFLFLLPEFYGELPCGKCGCVGHVDAEEQKEGLAVAVAGGNAADTEVLLLVAEAALHYGGAQVTDDTAGGRDVGLLVLGLGTFADEVGRDATLGAILRDIQKISN